MLLLALDLQLLAGQVTLEIHVVVVAVGQFFLELLDFFELFVGVTLVFNHHVEAKRLFFVFIKSFQFVQDFVVFLGEVIIFCFKLPIFIYKFIKFVLCIVLPISTAAVPAGKHSFFLDVIAALVEIPER